MLDLALFLCSLGGCRFSRAFSCFHPKVFGKCNGKLPHKADNSNDSSTINSNSNSSNKTKL